MEKVLLIDGSSILYRAFFALPHFMTKKGEPTGAIYGFLQMLIRILKDEHPDYLAVAFDKKAPTFRHIEFKEYKSQRPPMPDELSLQFSIVREVLAAFGINFFELDGYEADDLIATFVHKLSGKNLQVLILSGDMDLTQLINDHVKVLITKKGVTVIEKMDREFLLKTLGVFPEQVPDYKALCGDSSDNIPGIPGVGPKTAQRLLNSFNSIESLIDHINEIDKGKYKPFTERIVMNKKLCTLVNNVPVSFDLNALRVHDFRNDNVLKVLEGLEFKTLLKLVGFESKKEIQPLSLLDEQTKSVGIVFDNDNRNLRGFAVANDSSVNEYTTGQELFRNEKSFTILKDILENPGIRKEIYDIKEMYWVAKQFGFAPRNIHIDVLLGAYLIDPDRLNCSNAYLAHEFGVSYEAESLAAKAKFLYDLATIIEQRLLSLNLFDLYNRIEIPLAPILLDMEERGIKIDLEYFSFLSEEIAKLISEIEKQIYSLAGISFNILSNKQLSAILFDELGLSPQKMGKFNFATSSAVLGDLIDKHPIVPLILQYRHLNKLKSSYIDSLPHLISKEDMRLHTHFQHLGTSTGRLRSTNPNLQNIPIKGDWGGKVRRGFISQDKMHVLVSADYSQIELRVLAHLSGDGRLIKAFQKDEDIHTFTAMEVFNLRENEVTAAIRNRAKVVNFGIIYGISAYGLSKQIGCSTQEAKGIIDGYFAKYQGVKNYIEETIKKSLETGETRTILGRRRLINGLFSKNNSVRENAKRIVINSPIQGSAADIIKLAMVNVYEKFKHIDAHIILQVHDELVIESSLESLSTAESLLKNEMEHVVSLSVPLKVNVAHGYNLLEAKA